MTEESEDSKTMTVMPAGKWAWIGTYVPAGSNDTEEQSEFAVYADDMASAVKSATETLPEGVDIVYLARSEDVSDEKHELSEEASKRLTDQMKRQIN
jgi:hypothetical protein